MTKRTIEFAMMPNRTTRARRMPRKMCTRRGTAPCSIKSFRCSGVQMNSSQSSHSKHVANSVSLLRPFGESLDNESISPISRWWRKTRNIRWRWSRMVWFLASGLLFVIVPSLQIGDTTKRIFAAFVDNVWWFSRNAASIGLRRRRRH